MGCHVYNRPFIRCHKDDRGSDTVCLHSRTVYFATHSSPLCVRFHTREAVSYGGCRSSHMEVPTRVRCMCGRGRIKKISGLLSRSCLVVCIRHLWSSVGFAAEFAVRVVSVSSSWVQSFGPLSFVTVRYGTVRKTDCRR
jgi:hypothetical protein